MPKLKTSKALKKRFKITGTGKIKRSQSGTQHLLSGKTTKTKRQARKCAYIASNKVVIKYKKKI